MLNLQSQSGLSPDLDLHIVAKAIGTMASSDALIGIWQREGNTLASHLVDSKFSGPSNPHLSRDDNIQHFFAACYEQCAQIPDFLNVEVGRQTYLEMRIRDRYMIYLGAEVRQANSADKIAKPHVNKDAVLIRLERLAACEDEVARQCEAMKIAALFVSISPVDPKVSTYNNISSLWTRASTKSSYEWRKDFSGIAANQSDGFAKMCVLLNGLGKPEYMPLIQIIKEEYCTLYAMQHGEANPRLRRRPGSIDYTKGPSL